MERPKSKNVSFKQLVKKIHDMKTDADRNALVYEIDGAYDKEKITFADHEMLIDLVCMIGVTCDHCRGAGLSFNK